MSEPTAESLRAKQERGAEITMNDVPTSICEVLLDVLVEHGVHTPVPRGIKPPPMVVALYEAAEKHNRPVYRALADWTNEARDERDAARTFLHSIASAQSQGTQEQTDWMIAQAREGLRRAGGHDFDAAGQEHAPTCEECKGAKTMDYGMAGSSGEALNERCDTCKGSGTAAALGEKCEPA